MCGEHRSHEVMFIHADGSSPRVRGTPHRLALTRPLARIIPACAGNTRWIAAMERSNSDHPRVCGEHGSRGKNGRGVSGSSPRVRGTLTAYNLFEYLTRIIPACAGNTPARPVAGPRRADHPRVCGEHKMPQHFSRAVFGSSPRVRGTHLAFKLGCGLARIIPACAGNTCRAVGVQDVATDHPRVCGEHEAFSAPSVMNSGSSPRVRGTLGSRSIPWAFRRIIPACAGNTLAGRTCIYRAKLLSASLPIKSH